MTRKTFILINGKTCGLALAVMVLAGLLFGAQPAAADRLAVLPTQAAAGPAVVQMTSKSLQTAALPEAFPELDLRLNGSSYPGCMSQPETPEVDFKTDDLELTGIAMIATCGWQAGETVTVTLMEPSGRLVTSQVQAAPARNYPGVYEADIFYQPGVDLPEGPYRFTIQGDKTTAPALKAKVMFTRPQGARLYALPAADPFHPRFAALGGTQRLRLNGFLANEPVRVLVYQAAGSKIRYYGYQDYTADSAGRLIVEVNLPEAAAAPAGAGEGSANASPSASAAAPALAELNFFAYGRETHFVALERFAPEGYSLTHQLDLELYCPGAQPPMLRGGETVRAAAGLPPLTLHQQPGFGSAVTIQAKADDALQVYGFPKCIDHAYWWKVSLSQPVRFGWVAEGQLGKYLLEVVK